jgi:hypothetical protein
VQYMSLPSEQRVAPPLSDAKAGRVVEVDQLRKGYGGSMNVRWTTVTG